MNTIARPLPAPRTDRLDAATLRAYLDDAWRLNDLLFGALVDPAAALEQPDPLRNPLVFYLGHTAAFYVNKLRMAGLIDRGVAPEWEVLFAKGVDPHAPSELDTARAWPAVERVFAYRSAVREVVEAVVDRLDWGRTIGWDDREWSLLMALEHDRIHFETSTMLFRQLPVDAVRRPEGWEYGPLDAEVPEATVLPVAGDRVTLGRPRELPRYAWDNEIGHLEVEVAPFEATRDLVANARLLEFVRAGGYERRELWSDAGWRWLQGIARRHPKFWVPDAGADSGFRYRAMFDELPLPLAWPAEVNGYEAQALCAFAGEGWRLPTEAEHAALSAGAGRGNLALAWGSPTPIGSAEGGTSDAGFTDARGNVWEWLADDYRPFPGFEPHPYYEDFSAPYFDDDHALIAGGCWASTGESAVTTYRNWFRRHFYQHAGLRMARDARGEGQ